MANATCPPDQCRPIPPRFRWLKRISLAGGILVCVLGGLRWWASWTGERRLRALVESCRAAGQPIHGEDFDGPAVSVDENAAKCYEAAGRQPWIQPYGVWIDFSVLLGDADASTEFPEDFDLFLAAHQKQLELLREARSRPRVDWGVRLRSPIINTLLPMLSPLRQLAKLGCLSAARQHVRGDHAEAVEALRDVLAAGRNLCEMRGMAIGHLVAVAIDALACATIERLAPTLITDDARHPIPETIAANPGDEDGYFSRNHLWGTGPVAGWPACPAGRAQVRALIADLLDESAFQKSILWGMYGERASTLDIAEIWLRKGTAGMGVPSSYQTAMRTVFRPLLLADARRLLESGTKTAEAAQASNWPEAARRMPRVSQPESSWVRFSRPLSSLLGWSPERALQLHFRALATRRMAATALAIRLYELDHGRRPASLAQLVPDYLPAVPQDPFAEDGRALGYRPDVAHPRLYSVGNNGIDENGEFERKEQSLAINMDAADVPFFLDGQYPPRAPLDIYLLETPPPAPAGSSAEAVGDDQDVENDAGDADQDQGAEQQP